MFLSVFVDRDEDSNDGMVSSHYLFFEQSKMTKNVVNHEIIKSDSGVLLLSC